MKKNNPVLKPASIFIIVLIIYAILGVFLLKYHQYQINPDGVSYISIAQKYLNGDFRNAVNGHWAPLFSWLLMPFLFLGLPPLLATKVLSLILGLLTIIALDALSYRFEMANWIRNVALFLMIPITLFFSFKWVTPDLLVLCFLTYYLSIIFDIDYPNNRRNGVLSGAMGGLAYLSKHYAFPFFVSHFLLLNVLHYFRSYTKEKKGFVLKNLLLGMAVFFIISGVWICLISSKYHVVTIGTAGKYNLAFIAPGSKEHPMHYQGFLKPPNKTAISAWEDPFYIKMESWNPIKLYRYYLKVILKNIVKTVSYCQSFSFLAVSIVVAYLLFCLPFNKKILQSDALFPLTTIMIFSGGYVFIFVESRYLWIVYLLLVLMGCHILHIIYHSDIFNKTKKRFATMLLVTSLLLLPLKDLVYGIDHERKYFKNIHNISKVLKNCNIRGNIASDSNWSYTLYLTYYLNGRYYGVAQKNINQKDLLKQLRENNIDYYFVWDEPNEPHQIVSNYEEKTGGRIPDLKIYALKEKLIN